MKNNLTKKRVTLGFLTAFYLLSSVTAFAQYKPIITNDPSGDAGTMGIDVKNLSYQVSSDKKTITFKVETYNAVSSWNNGGIAIYVDEDMNPASGLTPMCANKSMKGDRSLYCMNMMGMWMTQLTLSSSPSMPSDISSSVTIASPDSKTLTITIPMDKMEATVDGKFNLLVGTVMTVSSASYVDDLPNNSYSTMDVFATTGIQQAVVNNSVTVYPNPAVKSIHFSSTDAVGGNIAVYDITGKQIISTRVTTPLTTIPTDNMHNGIYVYLVSDKEGQLIQKGNFAVNN